MPNYGGGAHTTRHQRMRMVDQIRQRMEEMRLRGAFGGVVVEEDLSPVDVLFEELRRTVGLVRWMELKMMESWPDDLFELTDTNRDDRGSLQLFPTNEAAWFAVYQAERKHLATVSKMCIDAGLDARRVQIAENQANMLAGIINAAFAELDLTPEQEAKIPHFMPRLIRQMALPPTEET